MSVREAGLLDLSINRPPLQAVVGGGAAGLAAARELVREGHRVTVLEARPTIGGVWDYTDEVRWRPLLQHDLPPRGMMHSEELSRGHPLRNPSPHPTPTPTPLPPVGRRRPPGAWPPARAWQHVPQPAHQPAARGAPGRTLQLAPCTVRGPELRCHRASAASKQRTYVHAAITDLLERDVLPASRR